MAWNWRSPLSQLIRRDTFSAVGGVEVTRADTNITIPAQGILPRAFSKVEAGTVIVTTLDGSQLTFTDAELQIGEMKPVCIRQFNTGSTSTKLKIYW